MNSLQTIGVIGIGTMGRGSTQICAHAGLSVSMLDVDELRTRRGMSRPPPRCKAPRQATGCEGLAGVCDELRVAGHPVYSLCSSAIRIDREIVSSRSCTGEARRVLQRTLRSAGAHRGIAKLHDRMLLHLAMREKSVDSVGPAQNAAMENYVVDRLRTSFPDVLRGWLLA